MENHDGWKMLEHDTHSSPHLPSMLVGSLPAGDCKVCGYLGRQDSANPMPFAIGPAGPNGATQVF